ncbi:hypothetical protein FQZ97_681030 [compost metagenome]
MGRPGLHRLHRRPPDRRDARPQRPAPLALLRDRRRPGHHGFRVGRAARARAEDRAQVAPAARQDVPDRPGAGPHDRRRGGQVDPRQQQALQAVDREPAHQARQRQGRAGRDPCEPSRAARPPAGLRLHPGRHQVPDEPDGAGRRRRHRLHGQRQPAGRALQQEQAAVQLLQAAVRAGDQPADRPDPRSHRDVARVLHRPQAEPAGHQPGQPADAARSEPAYSRLRRHGEAARHRHLHAGQVQELRAGHHLPVGLGR